LYQKQCTVWFWCKQWTNYERWDEGYQINPIFFWYSPRLFLCYGLCIGVPELQGKDNCLIPPPHRRKSAHVFVKWCIKKFNKARNFDTLWRLQYSVSLQCDSLREKICGVSSRYLTVEDEEVNTTRFTLLAFKQEFSTFRVPLIHGSIKVSCKISQHKQKFQLTEKETLKKSTYIKETRNELRIHNFFFKFNC
jgi:hypothetical protein